MIIAGLVVLTPLFEGDDRVYAYAIGVVAGTLVQLLMTRPVAAAGSASRSGRLRLPRRDDPLVRRVLMLMLPVSVGLGLINIDLVLNSMIGSLVSDEAPAAIDKAFRIYMLPAGDVLGRRRDGRVPAAEPARRRAATSARCASVLGVGMRQIALLLIPAAAATIVLARPIVEVLYQRGEFDAGVDRPRHEALSVFAICLPFSGWNLILTRTFFSLQRPWLPTALALGSLVGQRRRLARAVPDRDRGRGARHRRLQRRADGAARRTACAASWAGWRRPRLLRSFAAMLLAAAALAAVAYGVHTGARRAARRGPDRADRRARRRRWRRAARSTPRPCSRCASRRPARSSICCASRLGRGAS